MHTEGRHSSKPLRLFSGSHDRGLDIPSWVLVGRAVITHQGPGWWKHGGSVSAFSGSHGSWGCHDRWRGGFKGWALPGSVHITRVPTSLSEQVHCKGGWGVTRIMWVTAEWQALHPQTKTHEVLLCVCPRVPAKYLRFYLREQKINEESASCLCPEKIVGSKLEEINKEKGRNK